MASFRLRRLNEAASLVAAVRLAVDAGLLDVLDGDGATLPALLDATDLRDRTVAVLLRQLAHAGVVRRARDGTYRTAVPASGVSWTLDRWSDLPRVAAGDEPVSTGHAYPAIVGLLARELAPAHAAVADLLHEPGVRLLDLGGGAAPAGLLLLERDATAEVTVVDRAAVLDVLRPRTADAGDRLRLVAADLLHDPLPGGYDVALLSAVLHLFDEADVLRLLQRAARGVRPGGRVAVVEPLLAEDGSAAEEIVAYELDLHLRHPDGGLWPYSRWAAWFAAAGLRGVRREHLPRGLSLITGRTPRT